MFNFGRRVVTVTFVEESTGALISSSRMPVERLPETFTADFELKMSGAHYVVVKAEPPNKDAFSATKQLKVTVRKKLP